MSATEVDRADWDEVTSAFTDFFEGFGEVTVTGEFARFAADTAATGLELCRDGTSRSFMPLHRLDLRWDSVRFDDERHEVQVVAAGAAYTYRVPPQLLGD